jgi:hypothetical protein
LYTATETYNSQCRSSPLPIAASSANSAAFENRSARHVHDYSHLQPARVPIREAAQARGRVDVVDCHARQDHALARTQIHLAEYEVLGQHILYGVEATEAVQLRLAIKDRLADHTRDLEQPVSQADPWGGERAQLNILERGAE